MAIPDSTTVAPVFITDTPDYEKPLQLVSAYRTSIATAASGGDQRARWRKRPRYSLTYFISSLDMAEFSVRRSKQIQELRAPVCCPIWTDTFELSSMLSANVADLGATLAPRKFKVNSYAYFVQGSNSSFRLITAISSTQLTFAAGSFPTYTAGALVYPCIIGKRVRGKNGFTFNLVNDTDEQITVEEL